MLLRQREGQDNENNAQAPGRLLPCSIPSLWKEVPLGTGHEHQDTPSLTEPTGTSQTPFPKEATWDERLAWDGLSLPHKTQAMGSFGIIYT